jgi:biopolymer transport protein TolR
MQIASGKVAPVINVTPLIDVLLVLLITFMLLPSRTKGLKSDVPEPAPEDQPAIPNPQNIVVRIQKDRSIDINSQPVVLAELEVRLKSLFAVRPGGVLFVDGASELEFADVVTVIDIARGAGVDRIGLMTEQQTP